MVRDGVIPVSIEASVRPILAAKFRWGSSKTPSCRRGRPAARFSARAPRNGARYARESIVLVLENDGIPPLDSAKYRRVGRTGPFADNQCKGSLTGTSDKAAFSAIT